MVKVINLTKNKVTLVDDEDYEYLSKNKWYVDSRGYAVRNTYIKKKFGRQSIRHPMASLIMSPPKGMVVDHINHDKLDNRKENLRIATIQQNNRNRIFMGATWNKNVNKWQAQIRIDGVCKYLGLFIKKEDAVKIYRENAKKYYKEFAPQV